MDKNLLKYCATDEQLKFFNEYGYLVVEDALTPVMVERLNLVIDRIDVKERARLGLEPHRIMQKFRAIIEDDLFLDLLDNPRIFPIIWDILGWNIQHYISHLVIYPPEPSNTVRQSDPGGGWHQDGGRPLVEIERPAPRLSLKVSYWLSDVSEKDRGAMQIIPGSHKFDSKPTEEDFENAMDVLARPGTAVLFDRRIWHRRGWNYSDVTRKAFFLGYSYRWLRGLDYNLMPPEILAKCDPIRRQLLGDGVDVKGWWQPTDADVPLKTWLEGHRGKQYVS